MTAETYTRCESSDEDVVKVSERVMSGLHSIEVSPIGPGNATVSIDGVDKFGRTPVIDANVEGHSFSVDVNHPPEAMRAVASEDGSNVVTR